MSPGVRSPGDSDILDEIPQTWNANYRIQKQGATHLTQSPEETSQVPNDESRSEFSPNLTMQYSCFFGARQKFISSNFEYQSQNEKKQSRMNPPNPKPSRRRRRKQVPKWSVQEFWHFGEYSSISECQSQDARTEENPPNSKAKKKNFGGAQPMNPGVSSPQIPNSMFL